MLRRLLMLGALSAAAIATLASTGSAGVTGPAFYVDGTLYRTVGTPTDFTGTGAPARSFDTIYDFGGAQRNVATAAPGDRGYNGGRWEVRALSFPAGYPAALAYDANGSGNLDSDTEVDAAIAGGAAVDLGIVKRFECPVIKVPANG